MLKGIIKTKVKVTNYSPNYDAEQPENKKKGHQAIVFVDLNDAWLYYESLSGHQASSLPKQSSKRNFYSWNRFAWERFQRL